MVSPKTMPEMAVKRLSENDIPKSIEIPHPTVEENNNNTKVFTFILIVTLIDSSSSSSIVNHHNKILRTYYIIFEKTKYSYFSNIMFIANYKLEIKT